MQRPTSNRDPKIPLPGILPERKHKATKNPVKECSWQLYSSQPEVETPKCPPAGEGMNKPLQWREQTSETRESTRGGTPLEEEDSEQGEGGFVGLLNCCLPRQLVGYMGVSPYQSI